MSNVFKWELTGVGIIFVLGFILHEAYEISGQNTIVGIFAPVNESVWEHLKMAVTAVLAFSAIEYFYILNQSNNFFLAKTISLLTIPTLVALFHYSYRVFTGHHVVLLDIMFFLIAICIGQFLSYRILLSNSSFAYLNTLALLVMLSIVFVFIYFTLYPLELPIFQDESTGLYGIPSKE